MRIKYAERDNKHYIKVEKNGGTTIYQLNHEDGINWKLLKGASAQGLLNNLLKENRLSETLEPEGVKWILPSRINE